MDTDQEVYLEICQRIVYDEEVGSMDLLETEEYRMDMLCFDLEGVLVPEIWIAFSEVSGIPELRRTTRDEPNYNVLMNWRLGILREHHLGIREIQDVISQIDPLPGAKEFFDELRTFTQAVIISDTFKEFAGPLMKKLGYPTLFCNELTIGSDGMIDGYHLRIRNTKLATVRAFQSIGYDTIAIGDSFNDLDMLKASKTGILFRSTDSIRRDNPELPSCESYDDLMRLIKTNLSLP